MSHTAVGAPGKSRRYLHSLWLLSARDLKVRYSTSFLGYVWSVLDPLVMSLIYWFVFTQVFQRSVGDEPYIVFLITALLPWVWFNVAVSDFTRAFKKDARLVGLGLLIAPLCVLYNDLERTTALILRALFYASPIIYGVQDLPAPFDTLGAFNPLAGIMTLYRMAFFPDQWEPVAVIASVVISFGILILGAWSFRGLERTVLKEL